VVAVAPVTGVVIALLSYSALTIGGVVTMAVGWLRDRARAGDNNARAQLAESRITSLAAQLADAQTLANKETARADRLFQIAIQTAAAAPVAGALQRLLQVEAAARGDAAVSTRPGPSPGHDDLLDPFLDAGLPSPRGPGA
jgi:hypothetical protein